MCTYDVVALSNGGRYVYLWFTTVLHGLVVESLSYVVPGIDNFWHAQSMVMLLGRRLPLHIVFLCKLFKPITSILMIEVLKNLSQNV